MEEFAVIWKPIGPTSHDIVDAVRKITGIKKVGHAGTLDPFAEGVLVLGIGREATRQLSTIVAKEKEYIATLRFGATSTTGDTEGEIEEQNVEKMPKETDVKKVLQQCVGNIMQTPPTYSAVKIDGVPAHRRVRRGEDVVMKARPVVIHDIALLSFTWPEARIRVVTGPGVYIRSLARDVGDALGVGAYLTGLIRTRVGPFSKDKALDVDAFARLWKKQQEKM
jgi:tRNA pseudouridine55 synthase